MEKYSFRKYAEWADYGFNTKDVKDEKVVGGTKDVSGHNPMDIIHSGKIISEITDGKDIGNLVMNHRFQDLVEWGSEPGALQLQITPLGSYKIITRRMINDLQGQPKWICKKIFPLEEDVHNTREEGYASEVRDYLESLNETMLETAKPKFEKFDMLSSKMFASARKNYPSYIMFPIGMVKKSDNYHKYVFEFRGHGAEAPGKTRAEQFNIDLYWDEKAGLVKCWGYNIDSSMRHHTWYVQPSEWEEWFAPSQDHKEIIESVIAAFMTY